MYVPMARFLSAPMTFVATRSMSPASFMRWKMVVVSPTAALTASTTGTVACAEGCGRRGVPPIIGAGSATGVMAPVVWFLACQDRLPALSRKPPAAASFSCATRMSVATRWAIESPWVATML